MDTFCFHVPGRKCARRVLTGLLLLAGLTAGANTPPTVTVSAAMRAGTTLMDVTYRVTDPDDATAKVRALAFVDGERSFAKVIRPAAWMEGTEVKLGDAIATGVDHTLTWDVRQDWNTDLGNLKFEVLCRDNRGLLEFDWITIPAAGGKPELTISKNSPTDAQVLDALFWQYAAGDPALTLDGADLTGTPAGGVYEGVKFVKGASPQYYAIPYLLKLMNLDPAFDTEVKYAKEIARAQIAEPQNWHAAARSYQGINIIHTWGYSGQGAYIPCGLSRLKKLKISGRAAVLKDDGTITIWEPIQSAKWKPIHILECPESYSDFSVASYFLVAISTTKILSIEFSSDYSQGEDLKAELMKLPNSSHGFVSVRTGEGYALALDADGLVYGWGWNHADQISVPSNASNIVALCESDRNAWSSVSLKADGTTVSWGSNPFVLPAEYNGQVRYVASGEYESFVILRDERLISVASHSINSPFPASPRPEYLWTPVQVAMGTFHTMVLSESGDLVAWGGNFREDTGLTYYVGQSIVPSFVKNVISIAVYDYLNWAVLHE